MRLCVPLSAIDAAAQDLTRLHLFRLDRDEQDVPARGPAADRGGPGGEPQDAYQYIPCSPDTAAAHLTGPLEAEIRKNQRQVENLRSHVMWVRQVFEESWKNNLVQVPIERLTNLDTIRSTLDRLSATARIEVAAAHPLLPPQEALEEGLARTGDVLNRGVLMRTLYPHSVLAHQYMQQHLAKMTALGAQIRTTAHVTGRIIFFDLKTVVIAGELKDAHDATVVQAPSLVDYLYRCWESTWDSARPFTPAPNGAGYGSAKTELRRSILELLESGMKDEMAARRLSMSTGTYRRHVTELMRELGAESRFQAGSYAQRAGWLDS